MILVESTQIITSPVSDCPGLKEKSLASIKMEEHLQNDHEKNYNGHIASPTVPFPFLPFLPCHPSHPCHSLKDHNVNHSSSSS